jgi:hypothetical protein
MAFTKASSCLRVLVAAVYLRQKAVCELCGELTTLTAMGVFVGRLFDDPGPGLMVAGSML